jgi:hypothetical protein
VTVAPSAYEGRLDAGLESLVPSSLRVVRAPAWPVEYTRRVGLGDLGLRAYTGLRRTCRALLARERFDALFITIYPIYPALLGPRLRAEFGVPFVLDYQDPWVGAWGLTVGGGPGGAPDWKSRATRRLSGWLEPRVVGSADALVAVSQGTIDGIIARIPAAANLPRGVVPLGFEPDDFERLREHPQPVRHFDPSDGLVHLSYVGTMLPKGGDTLRLLLHGLARARREDPAAARLRLHFFGTSNQSIPDLHRVMPVAEECGVGDIVSEAPGRLDYLDALAVLSESSGILLLGTSERHYTASKLYPALLARRPILALFHEASSVVSILKSTASEPSVRMLTYGDSSLGEGEAAEVACQLRALARSCEYNASDVRLDKAAHVSARALAGDLAAVLDRVAR